jgi:hypothetical protein
MGFIMGFFNLRIVESGCSRDQTDREAGLLTSKQNLRVWIKTWSEILEAATHKMKFVQQSLDYSPSTDDALTYLRETHGWRPDNIVAASDNSLGEVDNSLVWRPR